MSPRGGEVVDCVIQSLGADKFTDDEEIHGSCMATLQAVPETVVGGAYQARAVAGNLPSYGGGRNRAWNEAFQDDAPIVASLTKET